MDFTVPYPKNTALENPNQPIAHSTPLASQGYNHQIQSAMWSGNKLCQTNSNQNSNIDSYAQQMNPYYQGAYSTPNTNDVNRYNISPVSKDQNSNSVMYSSQYPASRQNNYSCTNTSTSYPMDMKNNCNNIYYTNVNSSKIYPVNNIVQQKKFPSSNIGPSQSPQCLPQSNQLLRSGTPMPQMPNYGEQMSRAGTPMPQMPTCGEQNNFIQNMYVNNCNVRTSRENQAYIRQTVSSSSMLSSQDKSPIHTPSLIQANHISQVSSIPTPPETSSLPCDNMPIVDNSSPDVIIESVKMNISSSTFALPGTSIVHMSNNMPSPITSSSISSTMPLRNSGSSFQPPANQDEGSQASSASASSSIPDDQNLVKNNSKPNFSYPPTPNTLSSPGAASMSSFHDDLECVSSPGWPKTPASPVANSNYEFANIKRPENLLKLYTLSDEPDRRYFLDKLIVFNEDRGSPITQCPTISKQPLDVFRVYRTVKERGGFVEVTNAKRWKDIAGAIGVGASSSAAYTLRKQYMKLLLPYECKFDRGGIDPQPIVNMVEASSRKKGKNATGAYGNPNPYQGYPQPVDRYSNYPSSYSTPRYQCNNMDYQCSTNAVHYPQTAASNPVSNQSQYNQYSPAQNSSNYGYYQGNNSTSSSMYNSSLQNNNNICRYGSNSSPAAVPQEQGFYSQQYSVPQQNHTVSDNSFASNMSCASSETVISSTNQMLNPEQSVSYSKMSGVVNGISSVSDTSVQQQKSIQDNFGNVNMSSVSIGSSSIESVPDKSYCNNYRVPKTIPTSDQSSILTATYNPTVTVAHTYQQPIADSLPNKTSGASYYSSQPSPSIPNPYPNQNQSSYLNQNSYSNQKAHYSTEYHPKEQVQQAPFGQYSDMPVEAYKSADGHTGVQNDISRSTSLGNASMTSGKLYPYNSNSTKVPVYNYGVQQNNRENQNAPMFSNQFNRPQRPWNPDHDQYAFQTHIGPRMPFKSQLIPTEAKQNGEILPVRKPWIPIQDPASAQNKLQNMAVQPTLQNEVLIPSNKHQAQQPNSMTVSQAFQSMIKKPLEFPPNTVEATQPVAVKRRRCPARRLGSIDPWRIMLALKSGLLAESTWALDVLSILLADNATVVYFGLKNCPGLLNVLVDHYRCFLNKIFQIATDVELTNTFNKNGNSNDLLNFNFNDISDSENKLQVLDSPNFTYKSRCKKKVEIQYDDAVFLKQVEIQYDEALFLIDPQSSWDKFEGFAIPNEHWEKGGGDITEHIQVSFDSSSKKIKFFKEMNIDNEKMKDSLKTKLEKKPNALISKGEPIVLLEKFNFITSETSESKAQGNDEICDSNFVSSKSNVVISEYPNIVKEGNSSDSCEVSKTKLHKLKISSECSNINADSLKVNNNNNDLKQNMKIENEEVGGNQNPSEVKEIENVTNLRGSPSSRKRFLCNDLEDEAYCFDEPALCVVNDSQEMLSRRCVCISTIIRNLSFVPGNDVIISKNPGVLLLLGRLLLLHHEHKPNKNSYRKYEKEIDGNVSWNESCISLKDEHEWWWGTLNVLRDNTLVILSNISGQLDLAPFPEEVSLPILDGLLHWIVCPSSYAQDPLPSRSPSSVLSPQRLSLEALCKLSVLSTNVDLIIATPPWSRVENLFAFLTKSLCQGQDQIMREFALILLSNISKADSVAAMTIAEQSHCISYLIAFIEEAEANAFQIAVSQGTKKLRDKPELMGTTPGMVQRAANTLKSLALVPENRSLFVRYQARLLSLVMSQVMDQELASIIADILFYSSDDNMPCQLKIS